MLYQATRAIHAYLSRTTMLNVYTEEKEKYSAVCLDWTMEYGSQYVIRFISGDDKDDVSVRVTELLNVQEPDRAALLPVINGLNNRFPYVKFTLDQNGRVNVSYDYLEPTVHPANSAEEIITHLTRTIDEAYPELMHALWGG
ncbi:MAG: hypothetical protein IJ343_12720 [Clostridia bacterium]|nr:hypothetical protein [Clostridia bacterium]